MVSRKNYSNLSPNTKTILCIGIAAMVIWWLFQRSCGCHRGGTVGSSMFGMLAKIKNKLKPTLSDDALRDIADQLYREDTNRKLFGPKYREEKEWKEDPYNTEPDPYTRYSAKTRTKALKFTAQEKAKKQAEDHRWEKMADELLEEKIREREWGGNFRTNPQYSDYVAKHPNPAKVYSEEEMQMADYKHEHTEKAAIDYDN